MCVCVLYTIYKHVSKVFQTNHKNSKKQKHKNYINIVNIWKKSKKCSFKTKNMFFSLNENMCFFEMCFFVCFLNVFFLIRAQYLRFVNSPSTYHQLSSIFHEIFVSCKFSGEINPWFGYRLDMTRSFIWNVTELFCLWHPRARKAFWRLEQVMQRDKLKRFPVPLPRLDTWPGEVLSLPELLWFVFLIVEEKNMFLRPPPKRMERTKPGFFGEHMRRHHLYRLPEMQFYLDWVIEWGIRSLWTNSDFNCCSGSGVHTASDVCGVDSKLRWQGKNHR